MGAVKERRWGGKKGGGGGWKLFEARAKQGLRAANGESHSVGKKSSKNKAFFRGTSRVASTKKVEKTTLTTF